MLANRIRRSNNILKFLENMSLLKITSRLHQSYFNIALWLACVKISVTENGLSITTSSVKQVTSRFNITFEISLLE